VTRSVTLGVLAKNGRGGEHAAGDRGLAEDRLERRLSMKRTPPGNTCGRRCSPRSI
jgi:hypothetical protein